MKTNILRIADAAAGSSARSRPAVAPQSAAPVQPSGSESAQYPKAHLSCEAPPYKAGDKVRIIGDAVVYEVRKIVGEIVHCIFTHHKDTPQEFTTPGEFHADKIEKAGS